MKRFDYLEPRLLEEAIALLQQHGAALNVLAGGTDLLVEIKEQIRAPAYVMSLGRLPGLDRLAFDEREGLRIGALVTTRALETHPAVNRHYPGLAQALRELGSIQVRNRATLAGNICRASPSADTLPPLIADGAAVTLHGPQGARRVPLEEFFTGPGKTVLASAELLTEIVVPPPAPHTGKHYIKHGRRKAMELATVGVAVCLTVDGERCADVRISLGAVAPTPMRAKAAEKVLLGKPLQPSLVEEAAEAAVSESRPISNVRGSAQYRTQMVRVLTRRALEEARRRAAA
ncbi:MAG TPA: xanthine dehydrogenase family protein subunit M [Burkholderiales bacterium]|nr:xanthine dehydrogenase family protein subunit M [Burkholderiales bacterium]